MNILLFTTVHSADDQSSGGRDVQKSIASAINRRLNELGLRFAEPFDPAALRSNTPMPLTLLHPFGSAEVDVHYSPAGHAAPLGDDGNPEAHRVPFVLGSRISAPNAEALRERGINFLDRAGNAYVRFGGVFIDIRGRVAEDALNHSSRPDGAVANLWSPKRAQVVFALLTWEELVHATLREIAAAAGVSLGQAKHTVDLLESAELLNRGHAWYPHQRNTLIERWADEYPGGLGRHLAWHSLRGETHDLEGSTIPVYVSGETASRWIINPETVTIYADELPMTLIQQNRWKAETERPTVFLRHKFWTAPGDESVGVHTAPWLLVYADLMATGQGRLREAARELRQEHV